MLVAAFDRLLLQVSGRLAFYEGKNFAEADWFELRRDHEEIEAELIRRQRALADKLGDRRTHFAAGRRRMEMWAAATVLLAIGAAFFLLLAAFAVAALGMLVQVYADSPLAGGRPAPYPRG
jgi:hypothetical protein